MIFVEHLCLKLLLLSQSVSAFTISQIYGEQILDQWNVFVTGPYGSSSEKDGEYFSDFRQTLNGRSVQPNHWPNGINIRSGGSIDAIQFFYGNYHGRLHGWAEGGELHKIRLYDGDMITKVTGRRGLGPGALVDQLTFHTEKGHVFGPYGGSGGYSFTAKPPNSDCYLAWISGKANLRVDSISFHWRCPAVRWHQDNPNQSILEDILDQNEDDLFANDRSGAAMNFEKSSLLLILVISYLHGNFIHLQ